jgi:hypothetical protein
MERRWTAKAKIKASALLVLALSFGLVLATGCGRTGGDVDADPTPTTVQEPIPTVGADSQEVLGWLEDAETVMDAAPATDGIDLDLAAIETENTATSDPAPLLTSAAGMEKDLNVTVPTVAAIP